MYWFKKDISEEKILRELSKINYPDSGKDIVSEGGVSAIIIKGDKVSFALDLKNNDAANAENLRNECIKRVKKIKGVGEASVVVTAEIANNNIGVPGLKKLEGVKKIIAVASGKGGVGKSTITVNLAAALTKQGLKIAIADADIYGPSIAKMLGITKQPQLDSAKKMIPLKNHDIEFISMGNLVDSKTATIWRGGMASKALYKLLLGVTWKNIDCLLIDMPPGTGDIQLSLAKNFKVDGAIIVSTPQEVALIDVQKCVDMFNKVKIPILGLIENMSYFEDPILQNKTYIFGKKGAQNYAKNEDIKFLGEVPLIPQIRQASDNGKINEVALKANFLNMAMIIKDELEN